jgi:hypothetical protein
VEASRKSKAKHAAGSEIVTIQSMVESSYREKLSNWSTDEALAQLHSDDESIRRLAVKVLIYDLSHLEFVAACLPLLADPSAEIRGTVLHDIYDVLCPYHFGMETEIESAAQMEEWIAGVIRPVANLISDPDRSVAYHGCEVLELMAQHSSSSIGCAELMTALDDSRKRFEMNGTPISLSEENATVRFAAVNALAAYGPRAKAALPKLRELVASDDLQVRAASIVAIDKIEARMKSEH